MLHLVKQYPPIYDLINNTAEEYPSEETIASRFCQMARLHAKNTALAYGEADMTYEELYQKSGQVAHLLAREGCGLGDFIGIYMERSLDTVIAILGVLRLGGVYVPIDPEHPEERNRHIVTDAGCKQLLTKEKHETSAASLAHSAKSNGPITLERCYAEGDEGFQDAVLTPDDLAYVIYTSGSTGKPKGTLIAHRGVINLWNTFTRSLGLTSNDVVTQFSTFSFDASILDTFVGLLNGAKLVLLTKEEQLTPELFLDLLQRQKVTHIGCVPTSVFNRLSEATTPNALSSWSTVKQIIIGGEALLSDHVRKFQDKFGSDVTIINAYGPTECTVVTTTYKVTEYWSHSSVTVPIGSPIGNYKVYVVKADGSLADVGEEGELYIETPGLSRGYLNLPEKTSEVFVSNPFTDEPSAMAYRSGDIVKLLPDGSLEFQSRKDGQLKLRGFRIEIGEIENALSKHTAITDAVVIAAKENNVVKHLSCFYSDKAPVSTAQLREHLRAYVPHYMIPSYFYCVDEIPLSPTGKVDRRKLEAMDHVDLAQTDLPYEEPVGDMERAIAEIWSEVLGCGRVGRNSSFFEIGGDSLAVMMVLSHLKLDYINLRMNDLYEHKTVQALAAHISSLSMNGPEEEMVFDAYIDLKELPVLPQMDTRRKDGLGSDILLTGGTGYLGSHLLYELLTTTDATIHVLVRPRLGENGISRLWSTLDGYFGQDFFAAYSSRIRVLEGNLTSEHAGLSSEGLDTVRSQITSIIHAGADVRHFGNADDFQATNVTGTRNLLNFVYDQPTITFHFISTIGIPEDMAASGVWEYATDSSESFYTVSLESVYTNSKLQAERLVAEAVQAGLPCSIYRAGNLTCHSETGHFQKNMNENYFYRMVKAFLLLGKAPEVQALVDLTPIDFAGRFMVSLMRQPELGGVYHICNPVQVKYESFIEALRAQGYAIDLLPSKKFEKWVLQEGGTVSKEGVQLAMAVLDGDGVRTSPYRYSSERSFLKAQAVTPPPSVEDLIARLTTYAVVQGYFPGPVISALPVKG